MDFDFVHFLFLGLIVAIANVVGGLVLYPAGFYSRYRKFLPILVAFGGGFMLAIACLEMIPSTIELWLARTNGIDIAEIAFIPMVLFLSGYLLTQFFEHTIAPHIHLGEEVNSEKLIPRSTAYSAIGGLMLHTFFDGVAISAAAQVDSSLGFLMFIAVLLHKFPEGFTVGSIVLATGNGFKQVLIATSAIGLTSVLGVIIFYFVGANWEFAVGYALPLSAGIMLYVAASDLIPEANHHGGKKPIVSIAVFAGVATFLLMHYLLHSLIE